MILKENPDHEVRALLFDFGNVLLGMKWLDLNKDEHRTMDTYMDT